MQIWDARGKKPLMRSWQAITVIVEDQAVLDNPINTIRGREAVPRPHAGEEQRIEGLGDLKHRVTSWYFLYALRPSKLRHKRTKTCAQLTTPFLTFGDTAPSENSAELQDHGDQAT